MILQRSSDLSNWSDLFLVTSDFNGKELKAQVGAGAKSAFYRLKPLSEPLRIRLNMIPGSVHLAKLVSGRDVEIDVFGTRDAEGYPLDVTTINYRVGNRLIVTEPRAVSNVSTIPPSASNSSAVPVHYLSGYVVVGTDSGCELPSTPPKVQFKATHYVQPGNSPVEWRDEVDVRYERTIKATGEMVYRYSVPFLFPFPCEPTDAERALNGLVSGLAKYAEWDPLNLAVGAVMIGATAAGTVPAITIAGATVVIKSINYTLVGLATRDGVLDDHPITCDHEAEVRLFDIHLRAFIPNGDHHFIHASRWEFVDYPYEEVEGPALVISVPCEDSFSIIPQGSHLRTQVWFSRNSQVISEDTNLELLQAFEGSESNGIVLANANPLASVAAILDVTATKLAIVCSGRMDVDFRELHDFSITGAVRADSQMRFRIDPVGNYANGESVEVEVRADGGEYVAVSGNIGRAGQTYLVRNGAGVSTALLSVGELYAFGFFTEFQGNVFRYGNRNGRLVFTLLGRRKW